MIFKRGGTNYHVRVRFRGKLYQFPTRQSNPDTARRLEREFRERLALEDAGLALPARLRTGDAPRTIGQMLDALELDLKLRGKLPAEGTRKRSADKALCNLNRARRDFGRLTPRELTAEFVDRYIEGRLAAGNKPASINRATQLLRQALGLARKRGHVREIPDIKRLSENGNARRGFCSEPEFRKFCSYLPPHLADFATFAYLTGMRFGEITSLKWEDVRDDTITLLAQNAKGDGRADNARSIPCVGELREILERRRAARDAVLKGQRPCPLIFHCEGRRIQSICNLGPWRRARTLTGRPLLFHDLRRSFARNADEAGISRAVVMQIAGWRSESMWRRYNIVNLDRTRTALEQLQEFRERTVQAQQAQPQADGLPVASAQHVDLAKSQGQSSVGGGSTTGEARRGAAAHGTEAKPRSGAKCHGQESRHSSTSNTPTQHSAVPPGIPPSPVPAPYPAPAPPAPEGAAVRA